MSTGIQPPSLKGLRNVKGSPEHWFYSSLLGWIAVIWILHIKKHSASNTLHKFMKMVDFDVGVVIPSAGSSERMGTSIPKQYTIIRVILIYIEFCMNFRFPSVILLLDLS